MEELQVVLPRRRGKRKPLPSYLPNEVHNAQQTHQNSELDNHNCQASRLLAKPTTEKCKTIKKSKWKMTQVYSYILTTFLEGEPKRKNSDEAENNCF